MKKMKSTVKEMKRICREFVGEKFVQVKSESDFLFICKVTEGKIGNDSSDESMRSYIG